jgi:citrate lyase beta subunit
MRPDSPLAGARVLLFAPGHQLEPLAARTAAEAEIWVLDLEDLVPPSAKDDGRARVRAFTGTLSSERRAHTYLRISQPDLTAAPPDELSIASAMAGIVLPKVESAEVVAKAAAALGPDAALIATFETPRGVLGAAEFIAAAPTVAGALFGPGDMARSLDLPPRRTAGLATARGLVVLAAKAAGIAAIDGGYMIEDDLDGLAADAELSRDLGFDAKLTVFPPHVPLVRAALGKHRAVAPPHP